MGVRALDTACNYRDFRSHRTLARVAGDLLPEFELSTKVGFLPHPGGPRHSLEPRRLHEAVERSVDELGIRPSVIFLHSPERSLTSTTPESGCHVLTLACCVLAEAAATGMCGSWGIACWDPVELLPYAMANRFYPHPDILMVRAGLTLDHRMVNAAERLAAILGIAPDNRWGMSPFAGRPDIPVWRTTDFRSFLGSEQPHTPVQAAFRLSYELPPVARMAVGTDNPEHLDELITATRLSVAPEVVHRYREIIGVPAPAAGP